MRVALELIFGAAAEHQAAYWALSQMPSEESADVAEGARLGAWGLMRGQVRRLRPKGLA